MHWYHPAQGFEDGLCNSSTLSPLPIFLIIKSKQEPKLPAVVEKAVPTSLQKMGEELFCGRRAQQHLCPLWWLGELSCQFESLWAGEDQLHSWWTIPGIFQEFGTRGHLCSVCPHPLWSISFAICSYNLISARSLGPCLIGFYLEKNP